MGSESYKLSQSVLDAVEQTISRYQLLQEDESVLIAFSGGKDSSVTALVLRELGYDVHLATVGGIWKNFDTRAVVKIGIDLGFKVDLIDVRGERYRRSLPLAEQRETAQSLKALENLGNRLASDGVMGATSPCTACYNMKITALGKLANRIGTNRIIFGHHQDDALASFLKSALMVDDYHVGGNQRYDTKRFTGLVARVKGELEGSTERLDRWGTYVREGKAGTDEPPRQIYYGEEEPLQIVRPLFEIAEKEILGIRAENSIRTEGSGCAHGLELTRTAREIIHQDVVSGLDETNRERLVGLVNDSLHSDGTWKSNVRKLRDKLLPGYKGGGCKL